MYDKQLQFEIFFHISLQLKLPANISTNAQRIDFKISRLNMFGFVPIAAPKQEIAKNTLKKNNLCK